MDGIVLLATLGTYPEQIIKIVIPDIWNDDFGDSDRIQTCNLLIRSQMLYSVELRSRMQFPAILLSLYADLLLLDTSLLT